MPASGRLCIALLVGVSAPAALAGCGMSSTPVPPSTLADFPQPLPSEPLEWAALTPTAPVTTPFSGVGNQLIFAMTAYGDGFVVVGEDFQSDAHVDGMIWLSPDGTSWTRLSTAQNDLAGSQIDGVAASGHRLVAIGGARLGHAESQPPQRIVWVSDDGSSWRRAIGPPLPFDGASVAGVAGGPAGFVAWGTDGSGSAVFQSADGLDWQRASGGAAFQAAEVRSMTAYRGGFVAVGAHVPGPAPGGVVSVGGPDLSKAAAWWSPDGLAWGAAEIDDGPGLGSLRVGANGMLALGGNGCGGCVGPSILWRSGDGRHWHRIGNDLDPAPAYASDGARIIRADYQGSGAVATSTDGATWQPMRVSGPVDATYGMVLGRGGVLILRSNGGLLYLVGS